MSYQVLARQWRPRSFQQMVGQSHVLRALIHALDNQRLHHAYLFTGTRGVGKTSVARILAKCLNCEAGISSTPCDTCSTCKEIDAGRFLDLIEVDAASRTKVEDTRELLDNIQYAPNRGRFKIYLIDEVHMLSGHSFNALLKTLEEPPEHVKFLLATTDPQKLPVTVLSRCLQFHLKNMLPEQISSQLKHILDQEKISYELNALQYLAQSAEGSMRDALSLLDQAIAYSGSNITEILTREMLGFIDQNEIIEIIRALIEKNGHALIQTTQNMLELAVDFNAALEQLLTTLHQIALIQLVPNSENNHPHKDKLQLFATQLSKEDIQLLYQIALTGRKDLPLAPSFKIGFEMVLLRMLAFLPMNPEKIQLNSGSISATPITEAQTTTTQINKPDTIATPIEQRASVTKADPVNFSINPNDWEDLIKQLNLTGMSSTLANHCVLKTQDGNRIEFSLDPKHSPLNSKAALDRITQALSAHYQQPIQVLITLEKAEQLSPAAKQQKQQQENQQTAIESISQDDQVKAIIEKFSATIAPGSVNPIVENG